MTTWLFDRVSCLYIPQGHLCSECNQTSAVNAYTLQNDFPLKDLRNFNQY